LIPGPGGSRNLIEIITLSECVRPVTGDGYPSAMTVTRRRRAETQAETRRRLLDAAEALFEERGFHGASVAGIARRAGYTTGAIYSNFQRKEDLAVEVLDRSGDA